MSDVKPLTEEEIVEIEGIFALLSPDDAMGENLSRALATIRALQAENAAQAERFENRLITVKVEAATKAEEIYICATAAKEGLEIINKAQAEALKAAREAIETYLVGEIERPVGQAYRTDGIRSPNDRCSHDTPMSLDCEGCTEAHFEAALAKIDALIDGGAEE